MKSLEFYEIVNGLMTAANVLAEDNKEQRVGEYKDTVTRLVNFVNEKRASNAGFQIADLQMLVAYLGETRVALNALKNKGASAAMMENTAAQISLLEQTVALMDVTENLSLTQAVDGTVISNVRLGGRASRIGDNSSSRSMITVRDTADNPVEGFFTPEEKLFNADANKRVMLVANEMLKKHHNNQVLREFIEKTNEANYGFHKLIGCMDGKFYEHLNLKPKDLVNPAALESYEYAVNPDKLVDRKIIPVEKLKEMNNNVAVREFLIRARMAFTKDEIGKLGQQFYQYGSLDRRGIEAKAGSSVSGRNVAVSNVANILGIPDVVAKSVPITVKEKGKDVKGVFMKKAVGLDYPDKEELKNTDFMLLTGQGFSGRGLKQLADLQVLDYLCQYVDRHQNNLLYSIKDGKIDGVQAIDNDTSFGTLVTKDNDMVQNGSTLHDISVISESMKRTIENLQPETLAAAISGLGLDDAEITEAKNRLATLKNYIASKENTNSMLVAGKVKVIKDDEWKNLNVNDLARAKVIRTRSNGKPGVNIFSRTKFVAGNAIKIRDKLYGKDEEGIKKYLEVKAQGEFSKETEEEKKTFVNSIFLDELSQRELKINRASLEQFREKFTEGETKSILKNPAYINMKRALEAVLEFKHETEMVQEERVQYDNALLNLLAAASAYVDDCVVNGTDKEGVKNQLQLAKPLCEFVNQHESIFHQAAFDQQEAELNKVYEELQMEQKQYDKVLDVLTEKLAGQIQGANKAKVAEKIKAGPALRALLDEQVLDNNGELRNNYKYYADMATQNPKGLVDAYLGSLSKIAAGIEKKQSINTKTVHMFDKHLQNLNNAKTKRNSKEYEALIRAVDIMNKTEKLEVGVVLDEKQLYAVKLLAIKSSINDYIAHKAKKGVNEHIGDKLAVVEELNKEVSQKLENLRGEVDPFTLNGKKVDLSKLPITKAEEVEKARKANPNGRIPAVKEMAHSTDDCMHRIITKAIEKKYSSSHIEDLHKIRDVLDKIEASKPKKSEQPSIGGRHM